MTFVNTTKFKSGDTLPAGTYRMEVAENSQVPQVTFSKDGKLMATIKASLVTQKMKNSETEIDSVKDGNAQLVTEIRPGGWEQSVVFGSSGQHGSAQAGR